MLYLMNLFYYKLKRTVFSIYFQLTVADLAVYEITNQYAKYENLDFSSKEYTRFLAHQKLVEENQNLKRYIDRRPQEYPI